MKKRRFVIGIGISLALVMMMGIWGMETASAMEGLMIKVIYTGEVGKPVKTVPDPLVVSKSDCVYWANLTDEAIKIRFLGSEESIAHPSGFKSQESGTHFVTDYFKRGASSSVHLVKEGTYDYEIQTLRDPEWKTGGKIIVK